MWAGPGLEAPCTSFGRDCVRRASPSEDCSALADSVAMDLMHGASYLDSLFLVTARGSSLVLLELPLPRGRLIVLAGLLRSVYSLAASLS
jgi:hypothetical protein